MGNNVGDKRSPVEVPNNFVTEAHSLRVQFFDHFSVSVGYSPSGLKRAHL